MRILFASTRGVGHFLPLVPLIEAARRRGDELLVAGPPPLAEAPYLSSFPESFEDPAHPGEPDTRRFHDPALAAAPRGGERLVYVTFGTVAGGFEQARPLFSGTIEALADLPVPVLLTVGREVDPGAFDAPANVRIEQFVPQEEVLPRAAAVVNHGGSGSVMGALAAGVPQVVVPLFADQPRNAERVEALGAGVKVEPPAPPAIRQAFERVLEDDSCRAAAGRVADEIRAQPAAGDALAGL